MTDYSTREAFDSIQKAGARDGQLGYFRVTHVLEKDGIRIRVVRTQPVLGMEMSRVVPWLKMLAAQPEVDELHLTLVEIIRELARASS